MAINQAKARAAMAAAGRVIEESFCAVPGGWLALVETGTGKQLACAAGARSPLARMWAAARTVEVDGVRMEIMDLNANNAAVVRRFVKWTAPVPCTARGVSIGFSDWLGAAGACAALPFARRQARPVLVEYTPADSAAVQRNLLQAVDSATWGVLAEGYRDGYGANAAALRTEEEIVKALLYGYSIIGLDCGEKIHPEVAALPEADIAARYGELNEEFRRALEASYLNAEFKTPGGSITFTPAALRRIVLEYGEAIMHVQFLYNAYLKNTPWEINFELSLARPGTVLTPQEHYLVANELERNQVKLWALCLDGDALGADLALHSGIAAAFGYRLSFNDADLAELDVAAAVKAAQGAAHFKLTNTLWLAALQLIAERDEGLLAQIAAAAAVPPVTAQELAASGAAARRYAKSYRCVLAPQQGALAAAIKQCVAANHAEYVKIITKNIENFLKKIS